MSYIFFNSHYIIVDFSVYCINMLDILSKRQVYGAAYTNDLYMCLSCNVFINNIYNHWGYTELTMNEFNLMLDKLRCR